MTAQQKWSIFHQKRLNWLLYIPGTDTVTNSPLSWSWIWRLKISEKYKSLIWLACHNVVPTLSLHHRNIAPSSICSRCGVHEDTLFHCIHDYMISRTIWLHLGYTDPSFIAYDCVVGWLKDGTKGSNAITFLAGLWWSWRCRNSMCLNNDSMTLNQLTLNIKNLAEDIRG